MYWLASLVGMTTAVLLARLLLVQVRKLLEEVAGVVRTWRTIRQALTLQSGSAEGRVRWPEPQAAAQECGTESDRTPPSPELPRGTEGTHPSGRCVTPQRVEGPHRERGGHQRRAR